MVRSVSRSRGCARCLRRKIKCDERQPECSQCQRTQKPCPGAYGGLFMVHASGNPREAADHTRLTSGPSYGPVFEQALISIFVTSFSQPSLERASHDSWTKYLFAWVSSSATLGWSIRATTLAFYAQETGQEDLLRESSRWYGRALQAQRASLARSFQQSQERRYVPTEHDIGASLTLMYYELLYPTTTDSWMAHLRGTAKLLSLRGPQYCQVGASHLILRSVRLLTTHLRSRTQEKSCLITGEWAAVPFTQSKKTALDGLVEVVHGISDLLGTFGMEQPRDETADARYLPPLTLEQHVNKMTQNELLYAGELDRLFSIDELSAYCPSLQLIATDRLADGAWIGGGDFCSTMLTVMCHAVWIMVSHLKRLLHTSDDAVAGDPVVRCSLLLSFVHNVFDRDLPARLNPGSRLQLAFPLQVVHRHSPSLQQSRCAGELLDRLKRP